MLNKLRAAITVLNKGEELSNAAVWKDRQNLINTLVALIGAVAVFLPANLGISSDDVLTVASAIAVLAGLCNTYLTTATSARVGLPPIGGNTDGADGA